MLVGGSKKSGEQPAFRRSAQRGASGSVTPEGRRFEVALLVARLPAVGREAVVQRRLPLVEHRPAWNAEEVGVEAAEQCRGWWRPLGEERLRQQTPRGLLLTLQTEVEGGLRSMASPLWLLNRVVRRVWLMHQGQRVGPVYGELERQLGDAALALEWVSRMVAELSRVGILT